MAITIHQSPTNPNMANADLLYEVSSTKATEPQFQFVLDIQDVNRNTIQRIKQQPNPSGYGVFNVGRILTSYVSPDPVWKTQQFATSSFANKQFWAAFGEQFGTSASSSISTYNGINTTPSQAPAKSGSFALNVTDGLVEPNSGDWNFPSQSYYDPQETAVYDTYSFQNALTNASTTQKIQDGEYATLSLYNGSFRNDPVFAQDIAFVLINVYNAAGSNIQNYTYENMSPNGGGPRVDMVSHWTAVVDDQTEGTSLIHVGVGPQNIADNGTPLNDNWAYYTVKFVSMGDDYQENNGGVYAEFTFQKDTANCDYPGVRFAWKNEFGVWDYYTAKLAENSNVQIERNSYNASFVDYSTSGTTVPYNISNRGTTQFVNGLTQRKTVTTDYLNQTDADWLRELFYSTSVYVQEGTDMVPVAVTNATVTEKTNPRSQKLFTYTFEYEYANQKRARV